MIRTSIAAGFAAFSVVAVAAAAPQASSVSDPTVRRNGMSVTCRSCSKCPARLRFENDGRRAYVNLARLQDDGTVDPKVLAARQAAMTERAFMLMERVADVGETKKTRPLMGWSSWNTFGPKISDRLILEIAQAMKTNGLADAGYRYVNIDDGFQSRRHPGDGRLQINRARFPQGLKPVADGIHRLGLKAGIYSDGGADTCAYMWNRELDEEGTGFFRHDDQDCAYFFTACGFDFIKVDFCGGQSLLLDERRRYTEISRAIRRTGRDVRFNVCRWTYPGTWVADIAESWRTTCDIRANWGSITNLFSQNVYLHPYASLGHYNDMDMLEVGHRFGKTKTDFGHSDSGLTESEEVAHFGLWSIMSSPLLLGCDVRALEPATLELVTNPFVLAMNQNDLGLQAKLVCREPGFVMVKDADRPYGTARFVALTNFRSDRETTYRLPLADLELGGKVALMDLVTREDVGLAEGELAVTVPAKSAKFFRLDAETRLVRTVYEAEDGFCSDFQNLIPADAAKSPTVVPGTGREPTVVRGLGGRPSNDLVWRDVRAPESAPYDLVVSTVGTNGAFLVSIDGDTPRANPRRATLTKGIHEVRLVNDKGPMPDIDRLTVRRIR